MSTEAPLVIAHTHLYSALVRWMTLPEVPRGDLRLILERIWWRLDRALDLELVRMSARVGAVDAARAGVSCVVDHHESPHAIAGSLDAIAEELERAGLYGVVAYGLTARNRGEAEWRAGLDENARFLSENRRPHVRGLVGVHAAFTVPDEALAAAAALGRQHGVGLHIHVAEDKCDRDAAMRLRRTSALVSGSVYAHAVHLAEREIRELANSGGWLVHNPRSNRGNGVGYARLSAAGDRVALGTDGWDGDLAAEARALAECAAEAGEVVDASARVDAGARLAASIFGREVTPPATIPSYDQAEARAAAERLAARMRELG
jgi:cytosine/adenosine deaminase-related metal-dependent hydrolase